MEYLKETGSEVFCNLALKLAYGEEYYNKLNNTTAKAQVLSGTGGLKIAFKFLSGFLPGKDVYISDPTWPNHHKIVAESGLNAKTYRYYDASTKSANVNNIIEDFSNIPEFNTVLVHACGHNPTGCDLTKEDWARII